MSDDLELETFLRQFRPVAPPPLRRPRTTRGWGIPAAIAASVVLALFAVRPSVRSPKGATEEPPRRATLGALRHAVRAGTYESALDALDARVLPDPTREGGALRALADVEPGLASLKSEMEVVMKWGRSLSMLSVLACLAVPAKGAPAVPCRENAALRYWMAFAEMENPPADGDVATRLGAVAEGDAPWDEGLAPILDRNRDALATLHRGARLSFCDWGYEYEMLAAAPIANIARARTLSRLNVLHGMRLLRGGRAAEAVDAWLAGVRFSRDIAADGPWLAALVAGRSVRAHLEVLSGAVRDAKLDASLRERVAREIATLPEAGFDWSVAARRELEGTAAILATLERADDPLRALEHDYQLISNAKPDETAKKLGLRVAQLSDREALRGALRRARAANDAVRPAVEAAMAGPHAQSAGAVREAAARLALDPTVSMISPSVVRLNDARGEVVKARAELLALVAGR